MSLLTLVGRHALYQFSAVRGQLYWFPRQLCLLKQFRGRKKGYVPLLMHPFIPSSVWIGGCELSVKPRQAPVLPFPGRTFPPVDLPPFYQALVEMLGDLTTCFPYWQRLALVCACVCVCVYSGSGGGGFLLVVKKLHRWQSREGSQFYHHHQELGS